MFREGRHVQKNKRCYEQIHVLFTWFFINFSWKIDATSRTNHEKRYWAQKSTKNPRLERSFSPKSTVSSKFWAPSGSIWAFRVVPGASQKPLIFNRFSVASANRPGPAPGRPKGAPGGPPGTCPAPFWMDFQLIFWVHFRTHSFGDALIFWVMSSCFCFVSLNLSCMRVTLIRATEELLIDR